MRKFLFLIGIAMLVAVSNLQASGNERVKNKGAIKVDRITMMKDSLGLTDAQVSQIQAIEAKYKPTKDSTGAKSSQKDMKTLMESRESEIKSVLTDEQKAKYEAMNAKKNNKARKPNKISSK